MLVRLNKYLKDQGYCSRREADRWIEEGIIKVNGEVVTTLGEKVNPEIDEVEVNKEIVEKKQEEKVYIVLNKPTGYVTTMKKTKEERNIVTDLVKCGVRVFPVGRLDKETSGMLLLTNDGEITFRLTHPSFEHEKKYEVTVEKILTMGQREKLEKGVPLFGEKTLPTKLKQLSDKTFIITLKEGKNRQIRRICRKIGNHVVYLKRIKIGKLSLPPLKEGEWKFLDEGEKDLLLAKDDC